VKRTIFLFRDVYSLVYSSHLQVPFTFSNSFIFVLSTELYKYDKVRRMNCDAESTEFLQFELFEEKSRLISFPQASR
jgi:hypothetical protein